MQKWFRLFESIHYWIIEIISILLDVKNEEVSSSEVEICALARYSSQLQLSPGLRIRLVGPLVRHHFSRITAPRIFLIFCMNVPYYKDKKRTRRFFRENSCSLIIHENVLKNGHFWGFLTLSRFWRKSIPTMVTFKHLIW